jgi:transmembrane sensor
MDELRQLYQRMASGFATQQEKERLVELLSIPENEAEAKIILTEYYQLVEQKSTLSTISAERLEMIADSIILVDKKLPEMQLPTAATHRIHLTKRVWFRYAAAIILLSGIGVYVWNADVNENPVVRHTKSVPLIHDVLPGSDKAILTLSDGRKVELNNTTSKTIEDGTLSIKSTNGQLSYAENGNWSSIVKKGVTGGSVESIAYNTTTTPKGGQYKLTLADGTKVWLNAASSIRYPTSFEGNTREVSITGEAYFEVTKNKSKPFIVKTAADEITVLGTSFNVNSYPDENAVKTSLLEGSVKIGKKVLKPGDAYLNGKIILTDTEQDVAWKNGLFNFNNQDIRAVARQLARWYDLEVYFEGSVPNDTLRGEMGRDLTLLQVQRIFKRMAIDFRLEGRKMIFLP